MSAQRSEAKTVTTVKNHGTTVSNQGTLPTETRTAPGGPTPSSPRRRRRTMPSYAAKGLVLAGAVVIWYLASLVMSPLFLPGPQVVAQAAIDMIRSGSLPRDVGISFFRVLTGWLLGAACAVPLGLLAGRSRIVRIIVEPFVDFFRFIPPIAFLTLALIWLGLGETSKIALIFYASLFVVFISTMTGALSVEKEKLEAAASLGANKRQTLLSVVVPSTVPSVIVGLRTALGICFMTVVAAEFLAARSGVGYLIWNARLFARTDDVFVGIVTLGLMGLLADAIFRLAVRRVAYRYQVEL